MDYKGNPADGSFEIERLPFYTTIRIDSEVEIEYEERKCFGGYRVFLLNPERYQRNPTEEELAAHWKSNKRSLIQGGRFMLVVMAAIIIFGVSRNFLVFIVLGLVIYKLMKYDSRKKEKDPNLLLGIKRSRNEEGLSRNLIRQESGRPLLADCGPFKWQPLI